MRRKISKAEFDALSPEMKVMYVADGEGYKLPLVDDDDPDALRRARDREKEENRVSKAALADALAKVEELTITPARKTGDIATLEASWAGKLTTEQASSKVVIDKLKSQISSILIEQASNKVASSITATPEHAALLMPHITSRFEVVEDGDMPVVKIKDASGRISALNFEEFGKELVANPNFASIVVGSKASGAGGTGQRSSLPAGGAGKKFSEMSESAQRDLYRANPEEWRRLRAAETK